MNTEFFEEIGMPFSGKKLEELKSFLNECELEYDSGIEFTVNLREQNGSIAASGSIQGNVLKCIAVSNEHQGQGLSASVLTLLQNYAAGKKIDHLFLFTKPKNYRMFCELGFYKITQTDDVLLMENKRDAINEFVKGLERPENAGVVGAIVANCNPFTLGHRYLIEEALKQCDNLHLFILSEDKSVFSAAARFKMAEEGISDLKNVYLHKTSDYLISSAVFPTYFMKDKVKAKEANCQLDIKIFCEFFAKQLGITRRFVGTEPSCLVTDAYNSALKQILPTFDIELVEIERKKGCEEPISASKVRSLLLDGDFENIKLLVPDSTYKMLLGEIGNEAVKRLKEAENES